MSVIVQSLIAGLRPCAPTREKPRPVSLSCSPFRPRNGANGPHLCESTSRKRNGCQHRYVYANGGRAHQTVVSPGMHERWMFAPMVGVGCPARRRPESGDDRWEIFEQAWYAGATKLRGRRARFAAHHWWRSPVSLAADDCARPTYNHAAHSRAQRARKESPRRKPRRRFFSRFAREALCLKPNEAGAGT